MRTARLLGPVVFLWVAVAALPAAADRTEVWRAIYPLKAGGTVAVANVQGSIQVEGWDRPDVALAAFKTTAGDEARMTDVEIAVEQGPDGLRVRTLYHGGGREPVEVHYRLRVPRGTRLEELTTVNGNIQVRNLRGPVDARTLNGDIETVGVAGSVHARCLNGNVSVALRALPASQAELELETVNGDIILLLPARTRAALELRTVAGSIESHLPFDPTVSPVTLAAAQDRAGVPVRLNTVRGNIRVAEAKGWF
ncbi:MAG: DUF4097 domain-containing protein [Terriglobia bacterium]